MTGRVQPLALFYGWPSLVNDSAGGVARAASHFGRFGTVIFGDACPTAEGDPRGRAVAERVRERCDVWGYLSLGRGPAQPSWSPRDVVARLDAWARWGALGVLLDCAGRDFGVSAERLAWAVAASHDRGLRVVVNAWDPFDVLASRAELGAADALIAENDVLRHGAWRLLREYRGRVARVEVARRELGVAVWAIATFATTAPCTYDVRMVDAVVHSWRAAGAEPPSHVAFADPLYGASDNRLPLPCLTDGVVTANLRPTPAPRARDGDAAALLAASPPRQL